MLLAGRALRAAGGGGGGAGVGGVGGCVRARSLLRLLPSAAARHGGRPLSTAARVATSTNAVRAGAALAASVGGFMAYDLGLRSPFEDDLDAVYGDEVDAVGERISHADFHGRYDLQRLLGKGSFGEVWAAQDGITGQFVAVKKIPHSEKAVKQLRAEVDAMHACGRHQHVVELHAVWDVAPELRRKGFAPDDLEPRQWCIVMELAEGGGLFEQLVAQGAYSERDAQLLMQQFASALYHLHSKGVLHRDIKPENLVLASDPLHEGQDVLKVIDFGTALLLTGDEEEKPRDWTGTAGYLAPEQLRREPYGLPVDLWAAGVVLYILLSGYHPFDVDGEASTGEVERQAKAGKLSFDSREWRNVSRQAKRLVRSLLEVDPSKRTTASELVNHPWVRGDTKASERLLPDTHERLRAYTKARHAFHGSILLGILMHQVKNAQSQQEQLQLKKRDSQVGAELGGGGGGGGQYDHHHGIDPEGGGGARGASEFDALRAGYELFDSEHKGYITAADLRRVCEELGHQLSERELHNMMCVLAPTSKLNDPVKRRDSKAGPGGGGGAGGGQRTISYEAYMRALNRSFAKKFKRGEAIFKQGDDVDGFYIITKGQVRVLVKQENKQADIELACLGPGDFFGETGILEGRAVRSSTVVCDEPVKVLFMERDHFLALVQSDASGRLAKGMAARAEARQQARLGRMFGEMRQTQGARYTRQLSAGEAVFVQGERADAMCQVIKGKLRHSFTAPTGENITLGEVPVGSHFGYDALLSGVHDTTVTAATEATLACLPVSSLKPALEGSEWLQTTIRARADRVADEKTSAGERAARGQSESQLHATMAAVAARTGSPVDHAAYEGVLRAMERISMPEGKDLFRQGDAPTHVYLVDEGSVKLHYKTEKGVERVLAELGPGNHFGETAFLDGRKGRNTAATCATPGGCKLRRLGREDWESALRGSQQLDTAVREAAAARSRSRLRTIIELAANTGGAETIVRNRGEDVFKQGDPSISFYVVKSGKVQMSYETIDGRAVRTKTYGPGECFGASGAIGTAGGPGGASDSGGGGVRRNTATAVEDGTTLFSLPHRRLKLLMREDANMQGHVEAVSRQRNLLTRGRLSTYDEEKTHVRDGEAHMMRHDPPREAMEED